jgi:hypothetical protein
MDACGASSGHGESPNNLAWLELKSKSERGQPNSIHIAGDTILLTTNTRLCHSCPHSVPADV